MAEARPGNAWLRRALALSLVLSVVSLGQAWQSAREWLSLRAGRSDVEQELTLKGVAWYKPGFLDCVDRLERTLPIDAKLLVEPSRIETELSSARWMLFLNDALHPRQVFVRRPDLASGTLVDYPRWLAHHERPSIAGGALDQAALEEALAIDARGIEWRLRYPVVPRFRSDEIELYRRSGDGWLRVELAAADPAAPWNRARPESEAPEIEREQGGF
jgi:hypothetical protein